MNAVAGRRSPPAGLAAIALVAILVIIGAAAGPASAHALRISSDPAPGAALPTSPKVVTVTFSERPDTKLSRLRVLDSSGHQVDRNNTTAVAGQAATLQVGVEPLTRGVYTVVWSTVSAVDGHLAGGSFAFGVQVTPKAGAATATVTSTPGPTVGATIGRWVFDGGLIVLVGAAFFGLVCVARRPDGWKPLVAAGWGLAIVGAIALALAQVATDHISAGDVIGSSVGRQLAWRVVPLLVGALVLVVPAARRRRVVLYVLGGAGLVSMWGDVASSHAAATTGSTLAERMLQWLHFGAAALWVGGLLALVVALGGLAPDARARAARRFSTAALVSVTVLLGTGILRAINEVASWHALTATSYGKTVLVKVALLAVLIGLGAINRFRSVPAAAWTGRPLRSVARVELAVAVVVLVAAALLQGLVPPASVASTAPEPLVVTGHDFAESTDVRLEISPGTTGFNRFVLHATDPDTGKPVPATQVRLTFALPARADLGESTLTLRRAGDGTFQGSGANLSIDATWRVAVLIQQATTAVQVDLAVTPRQPPQRVSIARSPGVPDLYTVSLDGGRSVQIYLDPGRPGSNQFHLTYVDANGKELGMQSASVVATGPGLARATRLPVRRLDKTGHFTADLANARSGRYHFEVVGTTVDGARYPTTISLPVR